MEPHVEHITAITALAATQHGVIHLEQVRRLAPSEWARRRMVRDGWLEPIAPRVFAVAGSPATTEQGLRAGLLSLGPSALVSHRAAARVHGFEHADPNAVEFTVPAGGRGVKNAFVVHTTAHLGRTDAVKVGGLRATSATRTIIDLARLRVPDRELTGAIDTAVRLGLSAPIVLAERLAELRGPGRWGCRRLDALLVDSGGHTELERRFLRLVRRAGIPRPRTQVVHRSGSRTVARVDFLFEAYDLVVEVSGQHGHSSPSERARDAQRRNELQELGRTVYEYTWHHVTAAEAYVVRTLTDRLTAAGWSPRRPLRSADP
ncbi:MAG: hypothetical protein WD225_02950 [Ilumatobacteraceae bacterium]